MRGKVRPPLQVAEPLCRCKELRGVHRECRVGRARLSGHRACVVRRAGSVQRRPAARRTLPAAVVFQPHRAAGQPAVQRQPRASGQGNVCGHRHDAMLFGSYRHGAPAAPVHVPRIHIRAGHHHVRIHPELQTVPRVRFQERRVVVTAGQRAAVVRRFSEVVRAHPNVHVGVLLHRNGRPPKTAFLRHPFEPQ